MGRPRPSQPLVQSMLLHAGKDETAKEAAEVKAALQYKSRPERVVRSHSCSVTAGSREEAGICKSDLDLKYISRLS